MTDKPRATPSGEVARILESAHRLGVQVDEDEALQWLTAMAAGSADEEIVVDVRSGVFGHRISMLDFSPQELAHYRTIGRLVEFADEPGVVETALALSGSAAQSKIQTYPGDCDYFERVNIKAPSRDEACRILARIMRAKATDAAKGPSHQLIEVKFGSYPEDMLRHGQLKKAGSPISWTAEEVQAGQIGCALPDGSPAPVHWDAVAGDPGWCKLDWVIADPVRGALASASNMLDVTWEAPDGTITPLDGYLDPYFQEVYLEAASIPIFSKLARHVSADALDHYIQQLEHEVNKYLTQDVNYGKAAKRMYNIFRLTGRYEEAAFIRELFDEPSTVLYQVWSLIRTVDDAMQPGSGIPLETLRAQIDALIGEVRQAVEPSQGAEVVERLGHLRESLSDDQGRLTLSKQAAARAEVINIVDNFFFEKLTGMPAIKVYIDERQQ